MLNSKNNLGSFFNPRSIAIVGATEKEGKAGNAVVKNILNLGYAGKVFLVNPKHKKLFGKKCYADLNEINEKVDLAIVIIPAKFVNSVIRNAAGKIKNFTIISAGFSEIGEEGKIREQELVKIAERNNLNILGPNCLGFINPKIKLNASFASGMPKAGNVAFISQSGALMVALMDIAKKEGIKFSSLISIGNKARLDETDAMEYFANDENTEAIAIYIEGIRNGEKFIKTAEKISSQKPVVILKAGKTEKARKAIASHTGALAGSNEVINAVFEKAGILQADNLDSFFNLIKAVSNLGAVKNGNGEAIIITNAGGPGVLTADAFAGKEIKLAKISDKAKKELKKFLPNESSAENPIDLLGDAREDRYEKTLKIISEERANMVICALTPQDQTPCGKIAEKIAEFKGKTKKIIAAVFIGGEKIAQALDILKENNIPNFSSPEKAVSVLNKYHKWRAFTLSVFTREKLEINNGRAGKISGIIGKAKKENRSALLFLEAGKIMDAYRIKVVKTININDAKIKFPVAVKVDSDKILHKTDRRAIALNIKNQEELTTAAEKMKNNFPGENIIIQPMLEIQTELLLGVKRDVNFGPIIICGLGGIYTEVFKTAEFFIPPMDTAEIKKRLIKSKLGFLFKETRGQKPYNIDELAKIISKLMILAREAKEIKELDINPLLVYNDGKEAVAADVKIII